METQRTHLKGFKFSSVAAGIKKAGTERLDFALIAADQPASAAAVTTTNLVHAAPVTLTRKRIAGGLCSAVLINSGNANAFTAEQGLRDAEDLTGALAGRLGIAAGLVIPMSTGVIGKHLPMERMLPRIPDLVAGLDRGTPEDVAHAMMTTDTRRKMIIREAKTSAGPYRLLGLVKGAGMIAPNMATMLAIVLTDLRVESRFLNQYLPEAVGHSFNSITIDGDTSTNDTVLVMSGGHPAAPELPPVESDHESFRHELGETCLALAREILMDAEGATKLVEIIVAGAPDGESAEKVARTIADSPLVKTAFHGEDPNWGRIVAAAGRAGAAFDPGSLELRIGPVTIVKNGTLVPEDWEPAAHEAMKHREFSVFVDLHAGTASTKVLTTDFSEEYVTINADYRS